jgi:hypothetical protein
MKSLLCSSIEDETNNLQIKVNKPPLRMSKEEITLWRKI